ncbi:hypothetical protein LQW54_008868 [Pestalotiopsis sp. IQ-011]
MPDPERLERCLGRAPNFEGGITLDLHGLDSIDISDNGTIAKVGTGATWDAVYKKLDPMGRSVAGGRVAGVGVGGLTLGGGISHLPCRRGWTCDTVLNFQAVLSNGEIVNANAKENADLFFALRGGSNNFGIVTRIDLETFEQGFLWSASLAFGTSVLDADVKEFVRLSADKDFDQDASFLLSLAYIGSMGASLVVNTLVHAQPVENPPVYAGFKTMTALSVETEKMVPKGARSLFRTCTVVSTEAMVHAAYDAWSESVSAIANAPGISWVLSFDRLPSKFYARHAETNAFGMGNRNDKPLLVALLDVRWSEAADDNVINSAAKALFDKVRHALLSTIHVEDDSSLIRW